MPAVKQQHGVQSRTVMEFPADAIAHLECGHCAVQMGEVEESTGKYKEQILAERDACRRLLAQTTLLFLRPEQRYALAPRAWLARWRRFVNSSPWKEQGALAVARNGLAVKDGPGGAGPAPAAQKAALELESLTQAMAEFTVHVDGELRLLQHPPPLKAHREKWCQVRHAWTRRERRGHAPRTLLRVIM
jgi:hypothetical protein